MTDRQTRRFPLATVLTTVALILAGLANPARAQDKAPGILDQIPQGAAMFAFVGNCDQADAELNRFVKAIEPNQTNDQGLLDMMLEEVGAKNGFNRKGGMAVVMPQFNPMLFNPMAAQPPQILVIVPVTDYAAFEGNFKELTDESAPAGVKAVNMKGDTVFMKPQGDYAVLSNSGALLANYQPGNNATGLLKQAGALGTHAVQTGDLAVYIDWTQVGPIVQPLFAALMMQAQQQIAQQPMNQTMPGGAEAQKAMMRIYAQAFTAYIRDTQALLLVGHMSGQGAGLSIVSQFKPGSPSAKTMSLKPSGPLTFNRLPDQPYIMAMALDNQAFPWDAMKKMFNELASALPADSPMSDVLKTYNKGIDAAALSKQIQFAWYNTPSDSQGPVPMDFAYVYTSGQPGKVRQLMQQYFVELNDAVSAITKETDQPNPMGISYLLESATIAGQKVDKMSLKMDFPEQTRQQAMNDPGAAMVMGMMGEGFQGYVGQSNDALLMTMCNRDNTSLMKELIGVPSASSNLEKQAGITRYRAALPPHRILEGYMRIGELIETFAGQMAPSDQPKMPDGTPPVAFSASSHESGLNFHILMPTDTINAIGKMSQTTEGAAFEESQARPIRVRPE